MTADTIVPDPTDLQQFNRYAYVVNNPIRYTDPTGHGIDGPWDQAEDSGGSIVGEDWESQANTVFNDDEIEYYSTESIQEMMEDGFGAYQGHFELAYKSQSELIAVYKLFKENSGAAIDQLNERIESINAANTEAQTKNLVDEFDKFDEFLRGGKKILECSARCTADNFGLTIAATSTIGAGLPVIPTRTKPGGTVKGTSIASKLTSTIFPHKLKKGVLAPVLSLSQPSRFFKKSATVGRIVGRWVPVVGWGLAAADATMIGFCTYKCYQ